MATARCSNCVADFPADYGPQRRVIAICVAAATLFIAFGGLALFWARRNSWLLARRDWWSSLVCVFCTVLSLLVTYREAFGEGATPCAAFYALYYPLAALVAPVLLARFIGLYARHLQQIAMLDGSGAVYILQIDVVQSLPVNIRVAAGEHVQPDYNTSCPSQPPLPVSDTRTIDVINLTSDAASPVGRTSCCASDTTRNQPQAGASDTTTTSAHSATWHANLDLFLVRYRMDMPSQLRKFVAWWLLPWAVYYVVRLAIAPVYRGHAVGCRFDLIDTGLVVVFGLAAVIIALPLLLRLRHLQDTMLLRFEIVFQVVCWPIMLAFFLYGTIVADFDLYVINSSYAVIGGTIGTIISSVWVPAILSFSSSQQDAPAALQLQNPVFSESLTVGVSNVAAAITLSAPTLAMTVESATPQGHFPRRSGVSTADSAGHSLNNNASNTDIIVSHSPASTVDTSTPQRNFTPRSIYSSRASSAVHPLNTSAVDAITGHSRPHLVSSLSESSAAAAALKDASVSSIQDSYSMSSLEQRETPLARPCNVASIIGLQTYTAGAAPGESAVSNEARAITLAPAQTIQETLATVMRSGLVSPPMTITEIESVLQQPSRDILCNPRSLRVIGGLLIVTSAGRMIMLDLLRREFNVGLLGFLLSCTDVFTTIASTVNVVTTEEEHEGSIAVENPRTALWMKLTVLYSSLMAQFVVTGAPMEINLSPKQRGAICSAAFLLRSSRTAAAFQRYGAFASIVVDALLAATRAVQVAEGEVFRLIVSGPVYRLVRNDSKFLSSVEMLRTHLGLHRPEATHPLSVTRLAHSATDIEPPD